LVNCSIAYCFSWFIIESSSLYLLCRSNIFASVSRL
jgi:hypothetical protein